MLNAVVETKYGKIEGMHAGNPRIMVYRGVPYAAPPVGALRFMPPQEPERWDGVRACKEFAPISLQENITAGLPFSDFFIKEFYPYTPVQSEDSLYLNIWTPAETTDDRLPVMMWIHGGGLSSGYGHEMEFDGEALAKKGVIVITLNYRLGHVGFFAHPELSAKNPNHVSGNNTLLDHIQALKWIHENIRAFGGDPDNVLVFGQSGGAAATTSMLLSPLTKGLIHKAIIQSGISGIDLHTFGHDTLEYAENWGVRACEVLGMTLDELMAVPADQLVGKLAWAERNGAGRKPMESMDGYVLKSFPQEAGYAGTLKDLPIMTGELNGDKGPMFAIPEFAGRPNEEIAFKCFGRTAYKGFMAQYPPDRYPDLYRYMIENEGFYDMISFGERQIKNGHKAPYVYYFDAWMPGVNDSGFVPEGQAFHSAELWFMFGTLSRCWRPFDGRYYDLSDRMTSYWTNFARTGNPNGSGLPVWKPYDAVERNMMRLNENQVYNEERIHPELDVILEYFRNNA